MSDFDVSTFATWQAPQSLCTFCCAILSNRFEERGFRFGASGIGWLPEPRGDGTWDYRCPVCGEVVFHEDAVHPEAATPPRDAFTADHLRSLGLIAHEIRTRSRSFAGLFISALCHARWFVHFVTWNIDGHLVGALQVANERAKVRGIVTKVSRKYVARSLDAWPMAVVQMAGKRFESQPHTKLVVVDGLIAIKGSMNLSMAALMKASQDPPGELVEVETRPPEVALLNHAYFSPFWVQAIRYAARTEQNVHDGWDA